MVCLEQVHVCNVNVFKCFISNIAAIMFSPDLDDYISLCIMHLCVYEFIGCMPPSAGGVFTLHYTFTGCP